MIKGSCAFSCTTLPCLIQAVSKVPTLTTKNRPVSNEPGRSFFVFRKDQLHPVEFLGLADDDFYEFFTVGILQPFNEMCSLFKQWKDFHVFDLAFLVFAVDVFKRVVHCVTPGTGFKDRKEFYVIIMIWVDCDGFPVKTQQLSLDEK